MGVWHIILTVVLTFKQALALPNPVQINELQDGHVYQGSDIESEEMNLNILICSFNRLNFQIVNQNGYSRKYIDKIKENNSCQVYKISSSDNAVVISRNDTVLKKFKRSTMKRFSIKSYSTDTVWTILSLCSDNLGRKRLCRVNCPPGVCKDMGSSKNLDKPIHNETTTFGISKKIYSFQSSIASLLHPDNDQRFRFFKGAQINVKEKNITFTTCNCKHLDFEFLQRDGDPKHYHVKNRKAECQEYQIVSIYGKVQVHTENEKTETVNIDSFLEEIVLKCYSNETRWRISEDCSSSSPGRSCQINCLTRNCQETAEDITFKNSDKLYKTIIPQVKYVKKLEQPPSVPLVTISFGKSCY
ncbi:uncharacterized protein LOC135138131 isoform X2 [Zophobas morio]|uniref:uncharacterized protein LOC135138131 isoform X2 n=1 Tax=Zophobas morio TaxID=2755281 RepID=UPI0030827960